MRLQGGDIDLHISFKCRLLLECVFHLRHVRILPGPLINGEVFVYSDKLEILATWSLEVKVAVRHLEFLD
jgi:hypothetical protein